MHPSLQSHAPQPATSASQVGLAEQEAGSWLVGAAVVANNIVSCRADANSLARTSSEGVITSVGAKGWHRVTVLTTYMHELGVRVPYENGASFLCCPAMYMLQLHLLCPLYLVRLHLLCLALLTWLSLLTMAILTIGASFLFYPAPDFQGAQPTHGGYTATATDAGHRRPQQADAGTLTLFGAFPTPTFLAPSVRPACRVDNDLVVDAIVNEALGNVRRTYYGCNYFGYLIWHAHCDSTCLLWLYLP